MYTSIRRYTADPNDVADILSILRQGDIAEKISGISGFIAYYLVDCGEGAVASITIFDDQGGIERSNEVAAAWVKENILPAYSISPPEIMVGDIILSA